MTSNIDPISVATPNSSTPPVSVDPLESALLLVGAFRAGHLGADEVPEDNEPVYVDAGDRWAFLALVTSVNYRRNSAQLWVRAKSAYEDPSTRWIFNVQEVAAASDALIHDVLLATGVAIQPTRQVPGWRTIARSVHANWGSFESLVEQFSTFEGLRRTVQTEHRSSFPYLSGPKLFNYWAYTMQRKEMTAFPDAELIDVAVDSHVTKSSARMGLSSALRGEPSTAIAAEWRAVLQESKLVPTDLTVPLWVWSRAGFRPCLAELAVLDREHGAA